MGGYRERSYESLRASESVGHDGSSAQLTVTGFKGESGNLGMSEERDKLKLFVPHSSFITSMEFTDQENINALIPHIMNGLRREELIGEAWLSATIEAMEKHYAVKKASSGIVFAPSAVGLELYMWAHGIFSRHIREFFSQEVDYKPVDEIILLQNIERLQSWA